MPRKESTVVIRTPGRDADKAFLLTEMSASQAESWAIRVFLALARSGVEIPENIASAGMAGVAFLSLQALGGIRYEEAAPLLEEMMGCVQVIPDPRVPTVRRKLVEDDVEEVKTRLELRSAVVELHTGFSVAAVLSKSTLAAAQGTSSNTSTSPAPSQP